MDLPVHSGPSDRKGLVWQTPVLWVASLKAFFKRIKAFAPLLANCKSTPPLKSLLALCLLAVSLAGFSLPISAQKASGNPPQGPPSYTVSPPVVVIQVTPNNTSQTVRLYDSSDLQTIEGGDYLQKQMEVSWQAGPGGREEPLEFTIEEPLTLAGEGTRGRFGFINRGEGTEEKIEPEYILVKRDDEYLPLENPVEVLGTEQDSETLEFKLDEALFAEKGWKNVPAGVYKGEIAPSIDLPGSSENRLTVVAIVDSVVEISVVPDELNLVVEEPVNEESESIDWSVSSNNGDLDVQFSSKGLEAEKLAGDEPPRYGSEHYNSYFRYHVSNGGAREDSFPPGESASVGYSSGSLKLAYCPDYAEDKGWHQLRAGEYVDTVTITVSAD